ncbi:MAG: hypothetical protein KA536_17960 [Saprospiraceae bacterium]|nr:hypothetical protein [Saprospiraceae bacterium]
MKNISNRSLTNVAGWGLYVFLYRWDALESSDLEIKYNIEGVETLTISGGIQFQRNVLLLFDFFRSKYIEEEKTYPPDDQQGIMYLQFRDRMEGMLEECEEWVSGVLENENKAL